MGSATYIRLPAAAFILVLYAAIAFCGVILSGSLITEIARPDEAAHVVSGLMVRQYLAGRTGDAPLAFARDYYQHYPKVAIGHWPPLFYVLEGLWLLIFPVSKLAIFSLLALLAAIPAVWLVRSLVADGWAVPAALLTGAALPALPLMQSMVLEVMPEHALTPLLLGAAYSFGRFLATESRRDATLFGAVAGIACLVKANALLLALLPLIAIALTGRWSVLRNRSLWMAAMIVAAIAGPWYVWAMPMITGESHPYETSSWILSTGRLALRHLWRFAWDAGWLPAFGVVFALTRRPLPPIHASFLALILSVWLFCSFVAPHVEARHMLYALAPALYFGAVEAKRALRNEWMVALLLVFSAFMAHLIFPVSRKARDGYVEAAAFAVSKPVDVWLVSSGYYGEGAFIAEVALREPAPQRRIVRASQLLADSDWMGARYRLLAHTPGEVEQKLDGIDWIVADSRRIGARHHHLLLDAVERSPAWIALEPDAPRAYVRIYRRRRS